MRAKAVPADTVRPASVERDAQPDNCAEYCRQQKIDTALAMLSMFLEATRPYFVGQPSEDGMPSFSRQLGPKEESAYMSALDWLERYLDTIDPTGVPPARA